MGSSTTTTKGARCSTKESGTHAIRECVEASSGQSTAIYLRRSAIDERGYNTSIAYHQAPAWRYEDAYEPELLAL